MCDLLLNSYFCEAERSVEFEKKTPLTASLMHIRSKAVLFQNMPWKEEIQ